MEVIKNLAALEEEFGEDIISLIRKLSVITKNNKEEIGSIKITLNLNTNKVEELERVSDSHYNSIQNLDSSINNIKKNIKDIKLSINDISEDINNLQEQKLDTKRYKNIWKGFLTENNKALETINKSLDLFNTRLDKVENILQLSAETIEQKLTKEAITNLSLIIQDFKKALEKISK